MYSDPILINNRMSGFYFGIKNDLTGIFLWDNDLKKWDERPELINEKIHTTKTGIANNVACENLKQQIDSFYK